MLHFTFGPPHRAPDAAREDLHPENPSNMAQSSRPNIMWRELDLLQAMVYVCIMCLCTASANQRSSTFTPIGAHRCRFLTFLHFV